VYPILPHANGKPTLLVGISLPDNGEARSYNQMNTSNHSLPGRRQYSKWRSGGDCHGQIIVYNTSRGGLKTCLRSARAAGKHDLFRLMMPFPQTALVHALYAALYPLTTNH
jgi:hypothetical protein